MEEALIEFPTLRCFAGIDLMSDRTHYQTTIPTFRHMLEEHILGDRIYCCAQGSVYETVKTLLSQQGMTMPRA
jgi:hypothetical protein